MIHPFWIGVLAVEAFLFPVIAVKFIIECVDEHKKNKAERHKNKGDK